MNKSTLFIDESGKSSLAEKADEPFILTGVILDDEEVLKIEGFFNYIKKKFGIVPETPFHSYHVYENPETKMSDSKLSSLSLTLTEFIGLIPAKIKVIVVNKPQFRAALGVIDIIEFSGSKERKEMKEFPYRMMSATLFGWFAKYLNDCNRIGQIITDARRGGDAQLLKTLYLCKENAIPFHEGYSESIKNRLNAICFAEKGFLSGGVEITDLISFITYMHVRRLISANKNKSIDKLWLSIKDKIELVIINEDDVRRFFKIKKDGVHKHLKQS